MAAGVPCMTTPFVEQSGTCDAHFTWLKKIPFGDHTLIDAMQQPIGGVQFFTNSDDAQTFLLAWLVVTAKKFSSICSMRRLVLMFSSLTILMAS